MSDKQQPAPAETPHQQRMRAAGVTVDIDETGFTRRKEILQLFQSIFVTARHIAEQNGDRESLDGSWDALATLASDAIDDIDKLETQIEKLYAELGVGS
jgi:hypothetical protein